MRQHLILALLLREKPKPNPGDNLNAPKSGLFYKRRPSHLHWRAKTLEIHHLAGHRALLSVAVSAVKTDTGWIYNLPLPTHTQNACSTCVSHAAGVYVYQHKELLTVGVWGKEEGKCRGDAFCVIQSFQTYAWWFCFKQECYLDGDIYKTLFFFIYHEPKVKTTDDFLKEEIFANFPLPEEYSPNPSHLASGPQESRPKPPEGSATQTHCSTCLKNTWHARTSPEVTSEVMPRLKLLGPSFDPTMST